MGYGEEESPAEGRVRIDVHMDPDALRAECEEVRRALELWPPRLLSRYFYDEAGSQLFEAITQLPEYYQTRAERRLLAEIADEVVCRSGAEELVEVGSGAATKTRVLLDAMERAGQLRFYVPLDVSEEITRRVAEELVREHPRLQVHGIVGDFGEHLGEIPSGRRRLFAFLGSTIGNLDYRTEAPELLRSLASVLSPEDTFLLGVDLIKAPERIHAAYNDSRGLTAAFNRNILKVMNARFGADFDVDQYDHRALFVEHEHRVEMHLVARERATIAVRDLDLRLELEPGQYLLSEISTKFNRALAEDLLREAGLVPIAWHVDDEGLFALAEARLDDRLPDPQ